MPVSHTENAESIPDLIRGLDTDDLTRRRECSRRLIATGSKAVMPLVEALRNGAPNVRKSSAYLLGALKNAEALGALTTALGDEEPKVRQNAAVALGKMGEVGAVSALAEAARLESIGWVRASIFLALGAVGGEDARQTLAEAVPGEDEREREAYRKATDRVSTFDHRVEWNPDGVRSLAFITETPEGMEFVAQDEARSHGVDLGTLRPGLLACPKSVHPDDLLPRMRCIFGLLIAAGEGPPLAAEEPRVVDESFSPRLAECEILRNWRQWLRTDADQIRYRFSVQGIRLRKDGLRSLLNGVRKPLHSIDWYDSPSHYDVELVLQADRDASRFYVRPSFLKDHRFDYRLKDVGASVHPVVGAGLARLAASGGDGEDIVFDPVCGSGTLLIERAMLGGEKKMAGLDISPTAVRAAQANADRAALSERITVRKADAADSKNWPDCAEVLANLPFGMRTKHEKANLPALYVAVAKNLADHLRPGGRAVLYTTASHVLRSALQPYRGRLKVERQFRVRSGGMGVHVYVLVARNKERSPRPPL